MWLLSPDTKSLATRSASAVTCCGGTIYPEFEAIYFRTWSTENENKFEFSPKDWKSNTTTITQPAHSAI